MITMRFESVYFINILLRLASPLKGIHSLLCVFYPEVSCASRGLIHLSYFFIVSLNYSMMWEFAFECLLMDLIPNYGCS